MDRPPTARQAGERINLTLQYFTTVLLTPILPRWGLPAERAEFLAHPVSLTSSRFPNLLGHRSDERALPVHFCVLLSGFGLPAPAYHQSRYEGWLHGDLGEQLQV
jgi:hypothetical protein